MKTLMALVALLVGIGSLNAQAARLPDKDASWEVLQKDHRVIFELPQLRLESWYMRASSVCVEGDNLRSIRKMTECAVWRDRGDERYCEEEMEKYVYRPISGTRTVCVEYRNRRDNEDCIRYEDIEYTIPLSYEIEVYRRVAGGRDSDDLDRSRMYRPLFEKTFTIPACQ
ncbi:MAG: hypothetical protein H6624_07465 [Bdellovibrionaceae bacterium]|nr:hypothetical protein [Bdellovibrionales bacterium]MCB9084167.1 hypothetical protein [Pseudobdellovibrionaceae bacterium]